MARDKGSSLSNLYVANKIISTTLKLATSLQNIYFGIVKNQLGVVAWWYFILSNDSKYVFVSEPWHKQNHEFNSILFVQDFLDCPGSFVLLYEF